MINRIVKTCPSCHQDITFTDILSNPAILPKGLTFDKSEPSANVFYFNHDIPGCGTTFLVPVDSLAALIDEPIPEEILAGACQCEKHCLHVEDWTACSQSCHYAPYRRFLGKMLKLKAESLV